jgi:hypothetical protein
MRLEYRSETAADGREGGGRPSPGQVKVDDGMPDDDALKGIRDRIVRHLAKADHAVGNVVVHA